MDNHSYHKAEIHRKGYTVIDGVFSNVDIDQILKVIAEADQSNSKFRKTADLFAVRQFLKEVPQVVPIIFNDRLKNLLVDLFGNDYFAVKSIYFDKPELSNWFVAWHQDLTISVDKKADLPEFGNWTVKHDQFAVQPPLGILKDNFTIRIHLDNTGESNGALKVIPGSHLKGVYRPENIDWDHEAIDICNVNKGGVMLMRPLVMHASDRTTNNEKRRVIHIEFSRAKLPDQINWSEAIKIGQSS
jgi:hypothetical protein